MKYLIDTDVLIDSLRNVKVARKFIDDNSEISSISAMSVMELYAGVLEHEKENLEDFLSLFNVIQTSNEINIKAGLIKNKYYKSYGLSLADCVIASTAIIHSLDLITLNIKHYPMLSIKKAYDKR